MEPLSQQVPGILLRRGDELGLLLEEAATPVLLRFALVTQGTARPIFPALVLDDWGRERNTLALYRWVHDEGMRFPRAEVFGFTRSGAETQIFLRDLETFFKFPCYVYPGPGTALQQGKRLDRVFVEADAGADDPEATIPAGVRWPLRHAAVTWQQATRTGLAQAGWTPGTG